MAKRTVALHVHFMVSSRFKPLLANVEGQMMDKELQLYTCTLYVNFSINCRGGERLGKHTLRVLDKTLQCGLSILIASKYNQLTSSLVPRPIPSFSMLHAEKREGLVSEITCAMSIVTQQSSKI